MIIFRSKYNRLRVNFAIDRFKADPEAVKLNNQYPPAQFENCTFMTSDDEVIERMRAHSGNHSNNGRDFWEESAESAANEFNLLGEVGLFSRDLQCGKEDMENIKTLQKGLSKEPPKRIVLLEAFKGLTERFNVTGVRHPDKDTDDDRIKARIIELLGVLKDHGVLGDEGR
jgi:hypothetical protein